jgi:phosphatidyl-myo-inositol dimannoside synthase
VSGARVMIAAHTLAPGNGGVAAVARMTVRAVSARHPVDALAWQDAAPHAIGGVTTRAFAGRRAAFAAARFARAFAARRVIYDHAGTARVHVDLPGARRPYAVWLHGWELWHEPRADYLRALGRARLVIANSAYTVERAGRVLDGLEVRVCELGTMEDAPPPAPPPRPPAVLLVGRADALFAKGHDLLIAVWPDVVAAVPGARLLLAGGGSALARVQALAAASPARAHIEVAGFVDDAALDALWARATVFAMPGFAEGFGLVYADAMRRGLPIVAATDDAGARINDDGVTGHNVARADTPGLTGVLIALLRDADRARAMGAAGQARWRDRYTFSAFERRLMPIVSELLC